MCEVDSTVSDALLLGETGEPPKKRSAMIPLGAGVRWNLNSVTSVAEAAESLGKSPVSVLNELGTNVVYKILNQSGPAHCPSFTISVTVAGMTFEGWGRSKREARTAAARACLAALQERARADHDYSDDSQAVKAVYPIQTPIREPIQNGPIGAIPPENFPSVPEKFPSVPENFPNVPEKMPNSPAVFPNFPSIFPNGPPKFPSPSTAFPDAATFPDQPAAPPKSAINALYENYPSISFTCTYGDGTPLDSSEQPILLGHSQRFKTVCTIDGKTYQGYGSSKKMSKLAAAKAATAALAEIGPVCVQQDSIPPTLADHVGKLVNETFQSVMRLDPLHAKRKVLAGVVITDENNLDSARVICVTTGTKCVSGEHMSVRGLSINDCHAEVVARRCLQRWLYGQLNMYAQADDPGVAIPESELVPLPCGGYGLRGSRRLHLYVSTAPCGDGRIFSPHEEMRNVPDRHPNRMARGQLRTKIESGEGTIPVKNSQNEIQTWDGVMQGERLLTMSCSDKMARWNVVGLQGALLSLFVEPVYYHSVVLGSLLHQQHLYRALCGRIEGALGALPPPFALRRPVLAHGASAEVRTPARAPGFSVNYCADEPDVEVINATTGKTDGVGAASRLCKQSMFCLWQRVARRLSMRQMDSGVSPSLDRDRLGSLLYEEAKLLSHTYQKAKSEVVQAFARANLGRWVKKPMEQEQFVCEDTELQE